MGTSPICPQPQVDVGHLLRLPEDASGPQLVEDEFKCLNLNVHCPPIRKEMPNLPVLVWIHGKQTWNIVLMDV